MTFLPLRRTKEHRLNEAFKGRLREIYRTLDPVALLAQMRDAQNELGKASINGLESQR
ncbi:hypothetical protein BEL01nite_81210 [Bradyrhizobium elkanii]|nr:hypothetical protein BEL01nite_81210 [Bradyrhizobium elkanii]